MTIEQLASLIFGPWGAGIGLLILVLFLGRDHLRRDAKIEAQAEKSATLAEVAVAGWREQTSASATSAAANEKAATAIETISKEMDRPTRRTR